MKYLKALGLAALAVAVCLVVHGQGAGDASAHGSDSAAVESSQARRLSARVSRTNLTSKLEAGLGDAFGGVWFDPSGGHLHVGVTSAQSHRAAEAIAVAAGLRDDVVPTPVASTWTQLKVAQARWNDRLAKLFDRGEVSTSLAPNSNAVKVELAASLPESAQESLVRQADGDQVNVAVEVVPDSRLGFEPWARCAKFVETKAYCDPTLVSGVSINDEVANAGKGDCTAGPLVINKVRATQASATETFLLTAGHCITEEGAVGKKWFAYEKQGEPNGRKEIGKASAALIQEVGIGADVGVIKLEAAPWKTANDPPLAPSLARWDAANETNPFPVIQQVAPVLNAKTCLSGQRSGTQCGKIIGVGKVLPAAKGEWKEAFEIEIEGGGEGGVGDSGAPVFSKEPYINNSEGNVEGIVVGGPGVKSKFVYAQPLSFLLAELNKQKGLNFELLRSANEKRHHCP